MANFFSNLFSKKSSSVIGIDIGSSSIKVVQLSKRAGQAMLETYGELALGPYAQTEIGRATNLPPELLSTALIDVIRESKIGSKSSGLAIPFGASLITSIEMPALDESKLAQMIPLEARKYIPVPITEVMLDWLIVPKDNNNFVPLERRDSLQAGSPAQPEKIEVLLVAIHNETLSRYQSIVKQALLDTSFFEIEVFSTIRSVLDQSIATQMIIDMGAATTKVYVVEQGLIRTSHVINRGAHDVTLALSKSLGITVQEAEVIKRDFSKAQAHQIENVKEIAALTLDYIFADAERVLLSYQRKYNRDIAKVVMVGGGARLEGILALAEKQLQTDIALGDPFGKTEAPAFLEQALKNTGPEFAVAVGIALRKLQELG